MVLFPQPECPTKAIFIVAGIFKFSLFRTIVVRDGYLNSAFLNSIAPLEIFLIPLGSRVSISDFSSMILKIVPAASFALETEGALAREVPVPSAAVKRT
jgi:hypothetical protein